MINVADYKPEDDLGKLLAIYRSYHENCLEEEEWAWQAAIAELKAFMMRSTNGTEDNKATESGV